MENKRSKKKHILVISQYFYPEQFRINDICSEWVKKGYKVTVITGIPNYPQGKFFDGYGLFKKRKSTYNGVQVIRIPIIPRGQKTFMLAFNYMSYVISGFFWKCFTRLKADWVFIFQMSPMTQALIGVWYAKKRRIPCCIYVQDLWPESVEAITGINNPKIIRLIDKMVNYVYQNCNIILGTSPSFVKKIEERRSAWDSDRKSKVRYWPQYAEDFYGPVERKPLPDIPQDDRFKIVFTGNIGYAQGLDILPRIAVKLKQRGVDCNFVIIGDGRYKEELERQIAANDLKEMFTLPGRKKPEEIPAYLACCDVAFLSFADKALFEMTIPAKLQSYMACGMPVLAVAGGETRRIIEEAGCGEVCNFNDVDAIAAAILRMMKDKSELKKMGERAMDYSVKMFSKKELMDLMDGYIK